MRLLYDICASVAKFLHCKFAKNFAATGLRHSHKRRLVHDSLTTYFWEKICIKILNMFKTFATHEKFLRHSCETCMNIMQKHECRAKGPRLNSQNSCEEFACQGDTSLRHDPQQLQTGSNLYSVPLLDPHSKLLSLSVSFSIYLIKKANCFTFYTPEKRKKFYDN